MSLDRDLPIGDYGARIRIKRPAYSSWATVTVTSNFGGPSFYVSARQMLDIGAALLEAGKEAKVAELREARDAR